MIDEKKIEEAAFESLKEDEDILRHNIGNAYIEGFHAGINWFLGNLCHCASEEPPYYKKVLVDFKYRCPRLESFNSLNDYNRMCKAWEITRWISIDDLLKVGK